MLPSQTNFKTIVISTWLLKIADELDRRFGAHPMVTRTHTLNVMRELVDQSTARDKTALKLALETRIRAAFKETELDQ